MSEQPAARDVVETLDVMRIMEMIPHRYPFLMIDRVVDLVPGVSAIGIKNVTINEHHFQGHFPRQPVMPGVLIIECMAQTAAVLVVETLEGAEAGTLVYFMTVEAGRFRKPVVAGDRLHIHVTVLRRRGAVWKFSAEARVDGVLMAQARFTAMIMDD